MASSRSNTGLSGSLPPPSRTRTALSSFRNQARKTKVEEEKEKEITHPIYHLSQEKVLEYLEQRFPKQLYPELKFEIRVFKDRYCFNIPVGEEWNKDDQNALDERRDDYTPQNPRADSIEP